MNIRILVGNSLKRLKNIPDDSIHCVVTSPPYWGLRSYGTPPQIWGGDPECEHFWMHYDRPGMSGGLSEKQKYNVGSWHEDHEQAVCGICKAWVGDLGLEPTPKMFIHHLLLIFREVRRVLRPDGVCWVNIGDSYAGSWGNSGNRPELDGVPSTQRDRETEYIHRPGHDAHRDRPPTSYNIPGLKPKDMCMVPEQFALAMREDGWWVRSDVIWHKKNAMPESVTDRPTLDYEHIYLFTKERRYFYDHHAVMEEANPDYASRYKYDFHSGEKELAGAGRPDGATNTSGEKEFTGKRNRRSVWSMNTGNYSGAHFATFPEELPEICIKAGTSEKGCCAECGAPYERVLEKVDEVKVRYSKTNQGPYRERDTQAVKKTVGWERTCECDTDDIEACSVLDPFAGAGTTLLVAERLGRHSVGVELNPEYVEMAYDRIVEEYGMMFTDIEVVG